MVRANGRQRVLVDEQSPFAFSYGEFTEWYRGREANLLEPARATFVRLLNAKLDLELTDFDRNRIRVSTSRVKSPTRAWAKLSRDKYRPSVVDLDSVLTLLDDLVGVRIVCNNLADVEYLKTILTDVPLRDEAQQAALAVVPDSERPYIDAPKPSGYRAYHVNLVTAVPGLAGFQHIQGELQVRTLLQDGWGELTHEDTYKPGAPLPELVVTLSKRMADLLATVDDLAQDLRDELDRLAQQGDHVESAADAGANESVGTATGSVPATDPPSAPPALRQALLDETRAAVEALTKPAALATVAHRVRSTFGSADLAEWGGYKTFKALLLAAVPGVTVVDAAPGVVIPLSGVGKDDILAELKTLVDEEVPDVVVRLRAFDRNVPAIGTGRLESFWRAMNEALGPETWAELGLEDDSLSISELNRLSRHVRDAAEARDERVSRPHVDYALKALLWSGNLRPGLPLASCRRILGRWLLSRARKFGLVADAEQAQQDIDRWLGTAA